VFLYGKGVLMFKVYYTDPVVEQCHSHDLETLSEALRYTEGFRQLGMTFVTMVSENPNSVGKAGVDEIKDGKCPDGVAYDWNKASRIGQMKKR
jgi:hypothetical protein